MKRFLSLCFVVLLATVCIAAELPQIPNQKFETLQFGFNGQWLPSADPAIIGAENYRVLSNLRYTPAGSLESVAGYTEVNTSAISGSPEIDAGFHLQKSNPSESHVVVNADGTIYENTTAIPSQGNFSPTAVHTDASGAGSPRFSQAPYGQMAYANGVETMIWAGAEMPVSAFITSTTTVADTPTSPKDYTEAVNNDLTDNKNIAVIGGGIDTYTKLLMHMDGADGGTTFTDSVGTHTPVGGGGDENTDTAQAKSGVSSLGLDGTGDYVTVPDHADWFMSTSAFAVDFWHYTTQSATSGNNWFFEQRVDKDNKVSFMRNTTSFYFNVVSAGTNTVSLEVGSETIPTSRWNHFAIIRGWGGSANSWALCINGTVKVTVTDADPWPDLNAAFNIGTAYDRTVIGVEAGGPYYENGWIDEFRVSKGIARWTSNFTPPTQPYSTAALTWLVGSPRPLQGVNIYVSDENTVASTMTVKEWNGSSWVSLTITDNTDSGASLGQTGTVTWTSTVTSSKVKFIDNRLLYWYQFAIDDGDATIYRVTLNAAWQDIVDIWDGVFRQPIQFQALKSSNYEDYTAEVNDSTTTYYGDLGGMTSSEHLIVQFAERITALKWVLIAGKENTTAATVTIYYWNGAAWTSVGTVADSTIDDTTSTISLGQSGVMSWTPPDDEHEFEQTLFGSTGYAYKLVWSDTLTSSNAQINTLTGVPAQKTLPPYKFTAIYRDRLFLCVPAEGGQENRCDFSASHNGQIMNGEESSNGVVSGPVYFEGSGELTAATELYNRMGSNIFLFFIVTKANETFVMTGDGPDTFETTRVSENIGCPAPYSLKVTEVGFDVANDVQRHVALWVSYAGPVIFDGAVIYQIPGLEVYFDPNSDDYLGRTNIENAIAWFDQTYREYNIIISTSWFVYNLRLKRWFMKNPGDSEYPQSAWQVRDTSGNEFIYAGLDNGFMMRLEYGTSWDDGVTDSGINQKVQTGDFWPSKNVWDMTRIRRVKLIAKRIAQQHSLRIVHYGDGAEIAITDWSWDDSSSFEWTNSSEWVWDNGNYVDFVDLTGGSNNKPRLVSATVATNLMNWLHGLRFEVTTDDSQKGFQPIMWAVEYLKERKDY